MWDMKREGILGMLGGNRIKGVDWDASVSPVLGRAGVDEDASCALYLIAIRTQQCSSCIGKIL